MKDKLKQLFRDKFATGAMLNIDFVYTEGSTLVLSGWCANKAAPVSESVGVRLDGRPLETTLFKFERADVMSRYELPSDNFGYGFVAVVESVPDVIDALVLNHSNTDFQLSKQRFIEVPLLTEIVAHAGSDRDAVVKFLNKFDLQNPDNAKSKITLRHRDKDVEKVKSVLNGLNLHQLGFTAYCEKKILPDIHRVWKARQNKSNNKVLKTFGENVLKPSVSVIIPLYGRYDFIQHQMAQFCRDEYFKRVEIIYVLDDPQLIHEVEVTAFGVYKTFNLPFTLVISEHNLGFAGANNLGVEFATSDTLLLLNSDIIPREPGWLETYLTQFNSIESCGVLGATLIYEDNTVQHAGMEFREDSSYPGIWMNHHPFKGVPLSLINMPELQPTSITTGAAMMLKRELFERVGGFDVMYVLGDFEDSDLCLKCIDAGFNNYVSGSVVLYHLERLSQDLVDSGDWKFKLTIANGVYQASKWKSLIGELEK